MRPPESNRCSLYSNGGRGDVRVLTKCATIEVLSPTCIVFQGAVGHRRAEGRRPLRLGKQRGRR